MLQFCGSLNEVLGFALLHNYCCERARNQRKWLKIDCIGKGEVVWGEGGVAWGKRVASFKSNVS
jgi:hypothetical protein